MKAGRELDALIHEKVFGKYAIGRLNDYYTMSEATSILLLVPHYSTNIADAWQVVEKLNADHYFEIERLALDLQETNWICRFGGEYDFGRTAPEAICRCALKACGWR